MCDCNWLFILGIAVASISIVVFAGPPGLGD